MCHIDIYQGPNYAMNDVPLLRDQHASKYKEKKNEILLSHITKTLAYTIRK